MVNWLGDNFFLEWTCFPGHTSPTLLPLKKLPLFVLCRGGGVEGERKEGEHESIHLRAVPKATRRERLMA